MEIGDINGDGFADVAVNASYGFVPAVLIFSGNSAGTLSQTASFTSLTYSDFKLADINEDGLSDLIYSPTAQVAIRYGSATGLGAPVTTTNVTSSVKNTGDFNGDGHLDIVTESAGRVSVQLGSGNGTFSAPTSYAQYTLYTSFVLTGDLNGDGNLDVVTSGYNSGTQSVGIRLGNGDGTFGAFSTVATATTVGNLALGDLNGDGILDIVLADTSVQFYFGKGNGQFTTPTTASTILPQASALALNDINSDGVADLVLGSGVTGTSDSFQVFKSYTQSGVNSLEEFTLNNQQSARSALKSFSDTLARLGQQRGIIGASESRLNYASSTVQATAESYQAAYARITDSDVPEDSAKLISLQIRQKSSAAVLAQANVQPKVALSLLKYSRDEVKSSFNPFR